VTHANQTVSYVHDLIGETTLANYPNGVQAQQAFSERNQLLFKTYLKGTSPLITLKYGFNQLGQRIVGEQIDSTGSTLHRYGYNSRRELVASSVDGPKNQHSGMAYSLDQNDNLINDNGTPFTSNAADQLTKAGSTSLGYNGAGQATSVGQQAMTFAYNDQIKAITGPGLNAQYLYDGAASGSKRPSTGPSRSSCGTAVTSPRNTRPTAPFAPTTSWALAPRSTVSGSSTSPTSRVQHWASLTTMAT